MGVFEFLGLGNDKLDPSEFIDVAAEFATFTSQALAFAVGTNGLYGSETNIDEAVMETYRTGQYYEQRVTKDPLGQVEATCENLDNLMASSYANFNVIHDVASDTGLKDLSSAQADFVQSVSGAIPDTFAHIVEHTDCAFPNTIQLVADIPRIDLSR